MQNPAILWLMTKPPRGGEAEDLRDAILNVHEKLRKLAKVSIGLCAQIRATLANHAPDPRDFMKNQQDARTAVAMLLEYAQVTECHLYEEVTHVGTRQRQVRSICRETLLPPTGQIPSMVVSDAEGENGTEMRDIVQDGRERTMLISLRAPQDRTEVRVLPLAWFFGIRCLSDIISGNNEVLMDGRDVQLPAVIRVFVPDQHYPIPMYLMSIILRTLGAAEADGHYTCLICDNPTVPTPIWQLYDGLTKKGSGMLAPVTLSLTPSRHIMIPDELSGTFAIVGAYYQEIINP